jgi:hypothetical protein
MKDRGEFFSDKEAAKRRDEVVRRMAMTPPQHKEAKPKAKRKPAAKPKPR